MKDNEETFRRQDADKTRNVTDTGEPILSPPDIKSVMWTDLSLSMAVYFCLVLLPLRSVHLTAFNLVIQSIPLLLSAPRVRDAPWRERGAGRETMKVKGEGKVDPQLGVTQRKVVSPFRHPGFTVPRFLCVPASRSTCLPFSPLPRFVHHSLRLSRRKEW